jgi:uncharacterized membrane protein (DUF2068 family)
MDGGWCSGMMSAFAPPARKRRRHNRWLVLIAFYKGLQALLFIAIGVGALHMLHRDIADDLALLADHLNFNPESRFVDFVLDKASLINDPLLKRIGAAAFSYAGLSMAEGIGLYLEKMWGEYLTLAITISFLPWEIFEIFHKITWFRSSLLAINILVLFYLAKVVIEQARERRSTQQEAERADGFTVSSPYTKPEKSASAAPPVGTKRVNQHNL